MVHVQQHMVCCPLPDKEVMLINDDAGE